MSYQPLCLEPNAVGLLDEPRVTIVPGQRLLDSAYTRMG
jgi:hypothetical protein